MLNIEYEISGRVAKLTFDAGEVNALGYDELNEFTSCLNEIPQGDEIALVLASNHETIFYAGHDINDFPVNNRPDQKSLAQKQIYIDFYEAFRELEIPTICAIDGPAVGAGAMVTAVCDIRIASQNASFIIPEIDFGLVGGYALLRRHLPDGVLKHMVFTGDPLDVKRAYDLGYVTRLSEAPEREAEGIAEEIASKSPETVTEWKQAMVRFRSDEEIHEFSYEQSLSNELSLTDNTIEAISAYLEDRDPQFK